MTHCVEGRLKKRDVWESHVAMVRRRPLVSLSPRAPLIGLVAALLLWPALASAGSRAYYVAFFALPAAEGTTWPPGVEDALVAELLRCGEEPVADCRRTHTVDTSQLDEDGNVLLVRIPDLDAATAAAAARGRAPERRAVATATETTAVDGIVVASIDARGRVLLDVLDARGRRMARATGRLVDGALPEATVRTMVRRVMQPIERRFVP